MSAISIHRAALGPLQRDFLAFRTALMADWVARNAPDAFQRLYVCDAEQPHVLVPTARWAAVGRDVLGIEKEVLHGLD
jgi:hypothetical protein